MRRFDVLKKNLLLGYPLCGLVAVVLSWNASDATASAVKPAGSEYVITSHLPGDQTNPKADVSDAGGYLVWQDNLTDGEGLGISATRIGESLGFVYNNFRVNADGTGDQEMPDVAVLSDGRAAFVWQSGHVGRQQIVARVLGNDGVFITEDITVDGQGKGHQQSANVAATSDGGFIVVWAAFSDNLSDSLLQDVYLQRFGSSGTRVGSKVRINEYATYNQRSPVIANLTDGRFAISWISEKFRGYRDAGSGAFGLDSTVGGERYWIDVFARVVNASGLSDQPEFLVNSSDRICAHPAVIENSTGNLTFAWTVNSGTLDQGNRYDVITRTLDVFGRPKNVETRLNQNSEGNQYQPRLGRLEDRTFVVWTQRMGDSNLDDVYGAVLDADGGVEGNDFLINSKTTHIQNVPIVIGNGSEHTAIVWSGFTSSLSSFDLYAQRFSADRFQLPRPLPPFVAALSSSRLAVSWNAIGGFDVSNYLVFVDDSQEAIAVDGTRFTLSGLVPDSYHSLSIAYQTADGTVSSKSATAIGKTWDQDENFNGLPDDWELSYWGTESKNWPGGAVDSDGDGESNLGEFLAGTSPTNAGDVLMVSLDNSEQGLWARWSSKAGAFYKLQVSTNLNEWNDFTDYRFAVSNSDAVLLDSTETLMYFRVILRR